MKLKNTPLASLICVSLLGSAALSQAEVLWQLDFNSYVDGNIENAAVAQAGFPGNWFDGAAFVTSGVVTSGNSKAEMNQTFSAAVGASGTLWLSFDWGHNNAGDHASTYGGLTFFESNYPTLTEKGLLGNNWDTATWTGTSESNIGIKTAVAKITLSDTGSDTIELWVGATGSPVDVSGPPMSTLSMELSNVNCLRVNGGNAQTFDNLVIGEFMSDVDATVPTGPPASGTWANTADGQWDTASNWSGNIVATGSDSTANFNTLNIPADTTINLDSARTIGNLVFGDTDTSSAAGWTLTNNGTPANILTLAGTTPTITVNALGGAKTVTISTAVAGSAGLTKAGSGTLTLTAANSYSGATTVSEGTLLVSGQRYFNVGRATSVASGAVLELNDSNNTFTSLMPVSSITGAGTFRLSGNSTINQEQNGTVSNQLTFAMDAGGLIDLQDTSRLTNGGWKQMSWTTNNASMNIASEATFDIWDGQGVTIDALTGSGTMVKGHPDPNTVMLTLGVANGSGTFSGTIQNASGAGAIALTKTGSGAQTLSGTNTYNGNTTVEDGTLSIPSSGSLRFFPTTGGQTNSLSGTASATLSYLGTVDLDLSAAETFDGNLWTVVDVGSFSGSTLTPAAVTSTLGSFSENSPGTWELSAGGAKWTFTEVDGALAYEVTATDYEIWGGTYGLAAGSEGGDLDNDGVTNFEEYAFGLIPNSGASVNPIAAPLDKVSGTFSYTRRSDSGLAYSVWFSTDLNGWLEDTSATEDTPVPNGDNETVQVTLSDLPGDPLPAKLFIQVRAD